MVYGSGLPVKCHCVGGLVLLIRLFFIFRSAIGDGGQWRAGWALILITVFVLFC